MEDSWDWDLYTTSGGNIPNDLLEFFVPLLTDEKAHLLGDHPPGCVITAIQAEKLRRGIEFIREFGHEAYKDTNRFHKIDGNLYEIRSVDKFGNPRWLFVRLEGDAGIIFVHALKKKNNGRLKAKECELAKERRDDLERRRKAAKKPAQKRVG